MVMVMTAEFKSIKFQITFNGAGVVFLEGKSDKGRWVSFEFIGMLSCFLGLWRREVKNGLTGDGDFNGTFCF